MNKLPMFKDDTIVAPATPPGEGGIGIVRLSGPGVEDLLLRFFSPSRLSARLDSHYLYHGIMRDALGQPLDEVMAVLMRKPRSYTREDVAEIHCHGGTLVMRRILDVFLSAGIRLAKPGEFTLRAFVNGRIDLTQAEAVIDLIRSRSKLASDVALTQLEGRLALKIQEFRGGLLIFSRKSKLLSTFRTKISNWIANKCWVLRLVLFWPILIIL